MDRTAIEKALRRRAGASPEAREKMRAAFAVAADWYGTCTVCGEKLRGTQAELLAHGKTHDPS